MSRRTFAIAAALSVLALESPLITANANPLVEKYLDQGLEKYDAGNYQEAIIDYSKAIEINPLNVKTYVNRASAKNSLGDYEGAIDDYTKAIDVDPQNLSLIHISEPTRPY